MSLTRSNFEDFEIIVENENEKVSFYVHRFIICHFSDVFKAMLSYDIIETRNNTCIIKDANFDALFLFFRLMYPCDLININDEEYEKLKDLFVIEQILYLCEKYQCEKVFLMVFKKCELEIKNYLQCESLIEMSKNSTKEMEICKKAIRKIDQKTTTFVKLDQNYVPNEKDLFSCNQIQFIINQNCGFYTDIHPCQKKKLTWTMILEYKNFENIKTIDELREKTGCTCYDIFVPICLKCKNPLDNKINCISNETRRDVNGWRCVRCKRINCQITIPEIYISLNLKGKIICRKGYNVAKDFFVLLCGNAHNDLNFSSTCMMCCNYRMDRDFLEDDMLSWVMFH